MVTLLLNAQHTPYLQFVNGQRNQPPPTVNRHPTRMHNYVDIRIRIAYNPPMSNYRRDTRRRAKYYRPVNNNGACVYCGDPATTRDPFVSYEIAAYSRVMPHFKCLVECCDECAILAPEHLNFNTFAEKQKYIRDILRDQAKDSPAWMNLIQRRLVYVPTVDMVTELTENGRSFAELSVDPDSTKGRRLALEKSIAQRKPPIPQIRDNEEIEKEEAAAKAIKEAEAIAKRIADYEAGPGKRYIDYMRRYGR